MTTPPIDRAFSLVDVFGARPYTGNGLAVVHDGRGLSTEDMAAFARWTQQSETTFLLPPESAEADYRVRIFTPGGELPFAGHPTLGSCHVWLAAGGVPRRAGVVVQECAAGLVEIRAGEGAGGRLAFRAPPTTVERADGELVERVRLALGLQQADIVDVRWLSNGFPQLVMLLREAALVNGIKPDHAALKPLAKVGVVAPYPAGAAGAPADFELRFFVSPIDIPEDPVTGSLNANVANWLIDTGRAPARYVAAQGRALKRDGRVHVERDAEGTWIGGDVVPCISGTVRL